MAFTAVASLGKPTAVVPHIASSRIPVGRARALRAGGRVCARPSWADESEGGKITYDLLFDDKIEFPEKVRSNPYVARFLADQGWTAEAETLNGRFAMLGALHMTLTAPFLGDVLVQVANSPGPLALLLPLLTAASIAPRVGDPLVPTSARDPIMDAYKNADGPEYFTPELERAVGRLAMMAMGGFLTLAVIF
eukprot:CAMPEP_0177775424 /NCGR_PEP_ID=MMETSP0491_2-20121128/14098_1 /TAXON_ID=63592 /ORGANISM="Tetraselmis chuii, Strain PLY429" /LENGTH=192 /DNA_ID=CAMNT_0019293999 /DNA_START=152 /DNA_END=730 /DNA_ORIENTATION=+